MDSLQVMKTHFSDRFALWQWYALKSVNRKIENNLIIRVKTPLKTKGKLDLKKSQNLTNFKTMSDSKRGNRFEISKCFKVQAV